MWYKKELELAESSHVRFYVRYGGAGGNIPGFSIGLTIEEPTEIHTSTTVNKITFYIEEADAWYFEDKNLVISFDDQLKEPQFAYEVA